MNKNWLLFKVYFTAGSLTFSGGLAMLPMIQREVVDKYHLMDKNQLYEYSTLSQTFPGVIAVTNACFVGRKVNGVPGMFWAAFGAIFPAFAFMLLATMLYQIIPQKGIILSIMSAIRASSAAFLFSAAYTLARFNLKNTASILLAVLCLLASVFGLASAPTLIIIAGVVGVLMGSKKHKEAKA